MPDTTDASKLLHSCGAVLYTIKGSRLYVVLGKEGDAYFHFKGCCEPGETYEETAIREVYEETMGLVRIKSIALECESIASKKKRYHLGLVQVEPDIVEKFEQLKKTSGERMPSAYQEKEDIRLFPLDKILQQQLHVLTLKPILHYYNRLEGVQNNIIYDCRKPPKSLTVKKPHCRARQAKICRATQSFVSKSSAVHPISA